MVDVLDKKNGLEIDFYEVKLNKENNEVIWLDLSIQYYVCKKKFGDKIKTFNVVLRNEE